MRFAWLGLAALIAGGPACAAPPQVHQVTGVAADGTRYYEDSIVINAPAHAIWIAFTDTAAYRKWATPVSVVDFRIGGAIEASMTQGPSGRSSERQERLRRLCPGPPAGVPQCPGAGRSAGARGLSEDNQDGGVRGDGAEPDPGTVSGTGFGAGADFDALYGFFSRGDGAPPAPAEEVSAPRLCPAPWRRPPAPKWNSISRCRCGARPAKASSKRRPCRSKPSPRARTTDPGADYAPRQVH